MPPEQARHPHLLEAVGPGDPHRPPQAGRRPGNGELAAELIEDVRERRIEDRPRQPPGITAGETDFHHAGGRIVVVEDEAPDQPVALGHADGRAAAEVRPLAIVDEPRHQRGDGLAASIDRPHTAMPPCS